jgi:8-oxo-dGTP pyrophosphatase MutT (NUDIX family)
VAEKSRTLTPRNPATIAAKGTVRSVGTSPFYQSIREHVGTSLLLIPAVAAIIRDEHGRVLVQQQHDDSWSVPAGAVEPGEPPAMALVREVLEETGLDVRPRRIVAVLGGAPCRVRYANGDEVEYVVTVFECDTLGGALIDSNDETKRLGYFHPRDMPTLNFPYPRELFSEPREVALFEKVGGHAP